jgi:hypothetical protein
MNLYCINHMSANTLSPLNLFPAPPRKKGQKHALELRCEPIPEVRVAFIGLGMRMNGTIKRFLHIEGARIKVFCDVAEDRVQRAQHILQSFGEKPVDTYTGEEDWKRVCERDDIDLVYISTHYELHVPIAVYAMLCDKHVAIEVPAATTIEDCWKLVNTVEITRKHCMQLENCNYGAFEMATLNMVQQGLFGEVFHAEGAYIHDLKDLILDSNNGYWNMWRLKFHQKQNGNLYPTHGLGPLAHAMNIHRGDRFDYMVSMSTSPFSLQQYAIEKYGPESSYARTDFRNGDMNTSLIRTLKGKTIMLQHDITSPRPYSRIHMLSGTRGFAQKWPKTLLSFAPDGMDPLPEKEMQTLLAEYEHPLRKELSDTINRLGFHISEIAKNDGQDFIMDYRLIHCLRNGLPLDQDVYDAAEWSSVIELSERSVAHYSMPVRMPDFTRGDYEIKERVAYYR